MEFLAATSLYEYLLSCANRRSSVLANNLHFNQTAQVTIMLVISVVFPRINLLETLLYQDDRLYLIKKTHRY